jgi:metal-responsive CopG/Arc/MetJ family transcriptional regulator
MPKTIKIAISLSYDMLTEVEQERRESGESRSEFFRRAVEEFLHRRREHDKTERYILAYRQYPETKEEIEATRQAVSAILSGESW